MTIRQLTLQIDTEKLTEFFAGSKELIDPVQFAAFMYPVLAAPMPNDAASAHIAEYLAERGIEVVDSHENLDDEVSDGS